MATGQVGWRGIMIPHPQLLFELIFIVRGPRPAAARAWPSLPGIAPPPTTPDHAPQFLLLWTRSTAARRPLLPVPLRLIAAAFPNANYVDEPCRERLLIEK